EAATLKKSCKPKKRIDEKVVISVHCSLRSVRRFLPTFFLTAVLICRRKKTFLKTLDTGRGGGGAII
ncbi:MAG: hypothetical protein KH314_06120, partial [Subdoligranulum sp.]|nr:hypothetical protein [Subdoligranulum sp.]